MGDDSSDDSFEVEDSSDDLPRRPSGWNTKDRMVGTVGQQLEVEQRAAEDRAAAIKQRKLKALEKKEADREATFRGPYMPFRGGDIELKRLGAERVHVSGSVSVYHWSPR